MTWFNSAFESSVKLYVKMFLIIQNADKSLDCGMKLEHPEETHADTGKRELHTEGPQP